MNKHQIKWKDRKFDFNFPESIYPELIAKLNSTFSRIQSIIENKSNDELIKRKDNKWSIQENVGHLLIVDHLFIGRLDDYENGVATLRPADLSGKNTDDANFNSMDIKNILSEFGKKRQSYINRLENLKPIMFAKVALHPRLNKPMRLCDMLFFQAEHDDYHINRINELANN